MPAISTHQTTLQGVVYQLDVALQNPLTQKSGIVFIYDMSNSKYSNFDYDLSQKILTMLKVSVFFSFGESDYLLRIKYKVIKCT